MTVSITSTAVNPTTTTTVTRKRAPSHSGNLLLKGSSSILPPVSIDANSSPTHLLSYHQIPTWLQDNTYIHNGYRHMTNSALACLKSWTYLHNESINIFTHLLPAVAVLTFIHSFSWTVFPQMYPEATLADQIILGIFLSTAVVCFGVSAGFHTLLCHSERVAHMWLQMDFLGIIIMIEGCFVSGLYVGFYNDVRLMRIYWGMIVSLGVLCAIVVSSPRFQGPEWRAFRLSAFIATGLSAIAPIGHGIFLYGLEQMMKQSGLPYYLLEGVIIILGAWVYNARVPEKFFPGKFDIWGSSHQIFHVLVVVAMGVHFVGIAKAYDYNYSHKQSVMH